jgi:hypothetical protein
MFAAYSEPKATPRGLCEDLHRCAPRRASALTGLVAADGLVDDVKPAAAAHDAIVAMARPQGFDGILDFHDLSHSRPRNRKAAADCRLAAVKFSCAI